MTKYRVTDLKLFGPKGMRFFSIPLFATALLWAGPTFSGSMADPAPHDWTGFYAGLNAGMVKHTMSITDIQASTFYATLQEVSNPSFTGGIQAGFRKQLSQSKASGVYGLELSANFSRAAFNQVYGSPFALYQLSAQNELKNVYLLQFIGGIAADKALLFLAAGLSWSNITGNMTSLDSVPFFNSFNAGKKVFGTAVGGGVEYAVTHAISARFKLDVITPNTYVSVGNTDFNFQISNSIVQGSIGVNYTFG